MASRENNTECMLTCWGIAAVAGVLSMVLLYWMADFGALQAIFTGGLIGTVLGVVLSFTVCSKQTAADDLASEDKPAMRYAAQAEESKAARLAAMDTGGSGTAGVEAGTAGTTAGSVAEATGAGGTTSSAAVATSAAAANTTPSTAFAMQPSKPLAGEKELSERKGTYKYEAPVEPAAKAKPAAKKKPAAKAAAEAKPAAKAKAAPKAKAAAPAAADAKPALMLDTARDGGADDLKLISGVGPKLEQTLNDLGIYHFDQVAKFKKKDIAWVDERLRFKGRIERDDWMSQAKVLAKGGETEFSKKKKT